MEKAYEKHAWVLLLIFGAFLLWPTPPMFIPSWLDFCPGCGEHRPLHQHVTGMTWSDLAASNPGLATYVAFILRNWGLSQVGFAVLAIAISLTSYRKGERWAWYVCWIFPVFVVGIYVSTYMATGWSGSVGFALFLVVALLGLLLPYRKFFPRKHDNK